MKKKEMKIGATQLHCERSLMHWLLNKVVFTYCFIRDACLESRPSYIFSKISISCSSCAAVLATELSANIFDRVGVL